MLIASSDVSFVPANVLSTGNRGQLCNLPPLQNTSEHDFCSVILLVFSIAVMFFIHLNEQLLLPSEICVLLDLVTLPNMTVALLESSQIGSILLTAE